MVIELQLFNQDSEEQIEFMKESISELKPYNDNREHIDKLFRAIHTIKGGASLFEFDEIIHFAHLVEDFVESLRDKEVEINQQTISLLQECREHFIRLIDDNTENSHSESTQILTDKLINKLYFAKETNKSELLQSIEKNVQVMADKLFKKINFKISIKNQDFNQEIIKQIYNPLIHMIRNAIDHGIEEQGEIRLTLGSDEKNYILILKDSGKGIDKERVIKKAIESGFIKKDQKLEEKEIFNLIFKAGISTKEEISTISGRGVGMDIVKEKIKEYNATIEVESQKDIGTTFIIKFPKYLPLKTIKKNILNSHIQFRVFEKY